MPQTYTKQKQETLKLKEELTKRLLFPVYSSEKELLKNNGFSIIDNSPLDGALWVIFIEDQLKPYVSSAKSMFNVSGQYGRGKATSEKDA